MFTSTTTGDDILDNDLVTRSQLNAALLNFASNVDLGSTQNSTNQALTRADGNTSVILALDQRVTAEMATKLSSTDLVPYATQSSLTDLGQTVSINASAAQLAQLAVVNLQTSVANSLSLKADQSALEAINLLLLSAVTRDLLDALLVPYSTTAQTNQAIAVNKGVIESTAAATYATQNQVTQLSVEVAAKTTQAELTQALASYSNTSQTIAAIDTATSVLEVKLQSSLDSLQTTSILHSTQLDGKASTASVLQLASDLGSKTSNSELILALSPYATTTALTAVHAALTQMQSSIPYPGVTMAELVSLLLSYTTSTTTQSLNALVLQIQSDLSQKVSQANVNATLGAYVTTSVLQSVQAAFQASINAILANMGDGGTSLSNGAEWLGNVVVDLIAGSIVRNISVAGPLSLTEENGDNTLLLTADVFSKAESTAQLDNKMDFTRDLALSSLSAFGDQLVLKGGLNGFLLQSLAGASRMSIDSSGNTTFVGNVYAPNLAQLSLLSSYVKFADLFSNLGNYFSKTVSGGQTILTLDKFRLVAGAGLLTIQQLYDFGNTPTDAYTPVCAFNLNDSGQGVLQINGSDVVVAGALYTKAQVDAKDLALSDRIDGLSGSSTGNLKLYDHNYGNFTSGVISHPFGMQFAVTSAQPPAVGTVLMSMDVGSGIGIQTSLTVDQNLTVGGEIDCPNIYTKTEVDSLFLPQRFLMTDSTNWQRLGTFQLNSASFGFTMKICTNKSYNANSDNMLQATLEMIRSGGSSQPGTGGGAVNFACTLRGSNLFPEVRVIQTTIQQYQVWVKLHSAAGVGFFTVVTSGAFEFSGTIQTAAPSGIYINPFRLFTHSVEGLFTPQVQANGSILKLRGGSSGVQTLDASGNLLIEASTAGVTILKDLTVLGSVINTTNTSGTGFVSNMMNSAGVSSQFFVGGSQLFLGTNSAHPMRFATNRFVNGTSLTIETSGAVVCSTSFTNNSDSRLKDNQAAASLTQMMAIFDAVEVKTYDRNDLLGQPRVGFIAQDLQVVCTGNFAHIVGEGTIQSTATAAVDGGEPVEEQPQTSFKTVDYSRLVTVLWGVCKDLKARVEILEARIN